MRILIIEDAQRMADALKLVLVKKNYSVDVVYDGAMGLEYALSGIYEVIILDIMLPRKDGLSVLKEIRAANIDVPVLLLTAKSEIEDKVLGLDCGADDYLTKPFIMEELLARLRALSRRKGEMLPDDTLCINGLELNPRTLELRCDDTVFKLTRKEALVLELLMINKENTLSNQMIIERVWGLGSEAENRHVHVYISFLRSKLSRLNAAISIQNVRSIGYTLKSNTTDNRHV